MSLVTIELATERNDDVVFRPASVEPLRGRKTPGGWNGATAKNDPNVQALLTMTIPGLRIELDVKNRHGRIYDPLGLPENERLMADIAARAPSASVFGGNAPAGPANRKLLPVVEVAKRSMTEQEVATWFAYMQRLVRGGKAILVSGDLDQKVSGDPIVSFFAQEIKAPRTRRQWDTWRKRQQYSIDEPAPEPAGMA